MNGVSGSGSSNLRRPGLARRPSPRASELPHSQHVGRHKTLDAAAAPLPLHLNGSRGV